MMIRALLLSLVLCCNGICISLAQPKAAASKAQVENPLYTRWVKFKPGTIARIETVTENPKLRIEQTTLYKLIEVTDSKAVVDITIEIRQSGRKDRGPAQTFTHQRWFTLPPGRTKDSIITPANYSEEGTEKLTIAGKEFDTTWYKSKSRVEAGDTFIKEWYSDDAPGGLIKEVNETPAAKSKPKRELVEIIEPK